MAIDISFIKEWLPKFVPKYELIIFSIGDKNIEFISCYISVDTQAMHFMRSLIKWKKNVTLASEGKVSHIDLKFVEFNVRILKGIEVNVIILNITNYRVKVWLG